MKDELKIGDQVEILLDAKFGERAGWHAGMIFNIEPYSDHRSFYWVRFNAEVSASLGISQISVFNLKKIRKVG